MSAPVCELCGHLNPVTITGEIVQHWCAAPPVEEPMAEWEKQILATLEPPRIARSLDDLWPGQIVAYLRDGDLDSGLYRIDDVDDRRASARELLDGNECRFRDIGEHWANGEVIVLQDAPPADPVKVAIRRVRESMAQHREGMPDHCGICKGVVLELLDAIEAGA